MEEGVAFDSSVLVKQRCEELDAVTAAVSVPMYYLLMYVCCAVVNSKYVIASEGRCVLFAQNVLTFDSLYFKCGPVGLNACSLKVL